jgi:hypothetical protein
MVHLERGGGERGIAAPQNKEMKLTRLSPAPTLAPQAALSRRCRLMPAKSATAAGTASQLIRRVIDADERDRRS